LRGWRGKQRECCKSSGREDLSTQQKEKKRLTKTTLSKAAMTHLENHRPEMSLKELMSSCKDFVEEEMMLQSIARDLGVCVNRTPKCHCKLGGEGIEYAWACSKNKYRSILLENKRGKEQENGHRNFPRGQGGILWAIMCCTSNSQMRIAAEITAAKMRQSCPSNWSKW
jgi:hypothetical protein